MAELVACVGWACDWGVGVDFEGLAGVSGGRGLGKCLPGISSLPSLIPSKQQHFICFPKTRPWHEEIMVTLRPCAHSVRLYLAVQADVMQIECVVHLLATQALSESGGGGSRECLMSSKRWGGDGRAGPLYFCSLGTLSRQSRLN